MFTATSQHRAMRSGTREGNHGQEGITAMAVVGVNAAGDTPVALSPIAPALASLPPGAPVTIMIHGYRFSPLRAATDPHAEIFSPRPRFGNARIISWPKRLGYSRGTPGLAIGFGWHASSTIWQAHAEAARAAVALARLVAELRGMGAGPVGVIGHSLGARVALQAMQHLAPGDLGRVILLSAAEFRDRAEAALATPCGRAAQILNVTSRENDLFDFLFERLIGGPMRVFGPAVGEGLSAPNAVTLQIDGAHHRAGLRALGFPTAAPTRLVCHWSGYMRPGLFPLYRAFLHRPDALPLHALRAPLPLDTAPRWSRLLARPMPGGAPA